MLNYGCRGDSVDYGGISCSNYSHIPAFSGNTQTNSVPQYTFYCSENTLRIMQVLNTSFSDAPQFLSKMDYPLYSLTSITTGSVSTLQPTPEVRSIIELSAGEDSKVSYHISTEEQLKHCAHHSEIEDTETSCYIKEIYSKTIIPLVISIDVEHKSSCKDLFSLEEATIVQIVTYNTCRKLSNRETITPRDREESKCTVYFSVKRNAIDDQQNDHPLKQLCPHKKYLSNDFTIKRNSNEYIVTVSCGKAMAKECLQLYKEQLLQSSTNKKANSFTTKLVQVTTKPLIRATFCFATFLAVKHLIYYLHKGRNNKKYTFLGEINNPYTITTLVIAKILSLALVIYYLTQYYRLFRYEISKHEDQQALLDVTISSLEQEHSDEVNEAQASIITDNSERLYRDDTSSQVLS